MKFEVDINEARTAELAASIRDQLVADPAKREQLAAFALEQVLGWMSGKTGYQSLTEQHTEWLTELLPIFYPDDVPSAERIFNNFSVPYGRAAYISRVLLEKQQTIWRKRGKDNLRAALDAKLVEAKKNIAAGDALKQVPVSLDNISYRELTVLLEDLFRVQRNLSPPINKDSSPGRRTVNIPSQLFPLLLEKLGA